MAGKGPLESSIFTGRARSSPSESMRSTSTTQTLGKARDSFPAPPARPLVLWSKMPSSRNSRRISRNWARRSPVMEKARAISRLPTRPLLSVIKRRISCLSGKGGGARRPGGLELGILSAFLGRALLLGRGFFLSRGLFLGCRLFLGALLLGRLGGNQRQRLIEGNLILLDAFR